MARMAALVLALALALVSLVSPCQGALQAGFYKGKCGKADVEGVVRRVVVAQFNKDRTITAALLRMQFHDCFVNGCDASILLDGKNSEKTASPNLSVRGYEIIDAAKTAVEALCPGVISCADIIVMATRDAVSLSGGGQYPVQTGRKDGLVSLASNVNLPGPSFSVSQAISAFAQKGLSATDMVFLLGGHTVGVAHCSFFQDRLYNFQNTGKPDPTMDPALVRTLRSRCPEKSKVDNTVNLDQNQLSALTIDQELALDRLTNATVSKIAKSLDFSTKFGEAMVKLGALQSGSPGEIRKSCRAVNPSRSK
ncbi:hypothetical protein CRG98_025946 [Punica granatum]|uniref:Peroxidase n=1 Tax=Punica granatum TaxID=22663 RepID=A0A2I0JBU2_PUNGR|nr:hypothetical protein CRG98_025946 [Punica granatum]